MYVECDRCGYTVDVKPYHEGGRCPKCRKGTMKEIAYDTRTVSKT